MHDVSYTFGLFAGLPQVISEIIIIHLISKCVGVEY